MALRLCKNEITLSLQSISKEVHGRAARRVKTYDIPVKLRILPPYVRSENGPFRPDTEHRVSTYCVHYICESCNSRESTSDRMHDMIQTEARLLSLIIFICAAPVF